MQLQCSLMVFIREDGMEGIAGLNAKAFAIYLFIFMLWLSVNAFPQTNFPVTASDRPVHSKFKTLFRGDLEIKSPPVIVTSTKPTNSSGKGANHNHSHSKRKPKSPPRKRPKKNGVNNGKKVGLLFAGIAGLLQVAMGFFLLLKRKQMLELVKRHEGSST
eukprot:Gb_26131 [translate_table: standard]